MFGVSIRNDVWYHDRGDCAQSVYDLPCFIEPPHMGVTGSEMAIRLWEDGILLDCQDEVGTRLLEATAEQVSGTDQVKGLAHSGARTQPL